MTISLYQNTNSCRPKNNKMSDLHTSKSCTHKQWDFLSLLLSSLPSHPLTIFPLTLLCTKPGFKPVLFLIVYISQSLRPFFMLEYNFVVFKYFYKNRYILLFILYCCSIMLKLVWSRLEKKKAIEGNVCKTLAVYETGILPFWDKNNLPL